MIYIVSIIAPFLHLGLIIIIAVVEAISRKFATARLRLECQYRTPKIQVTDESNDLGCESLHQKGPVNIAK